MKLKPKWVGGLALLSAVWSVFLLIPKSAKAAGDCAAGQCEAASLCYDTGFCLNGQECNGGSWLSVQKSQVQCAPQN